LLGLPTRLTFARLVNFEDEQRQTPTNTLVHKSEKSETVMAEEAVVAMPWTLPPGQHREEDLTPAELRELKQDTAEAIRTAYAWKPAAAESAADMLFEELEPREKLVVCLRAEVAALDEALHAAYVAEAVVQARLDDAATEKAHLQERLDDAATEKAHLQERLDDAANDE
jgi:hypothetical protein